MTSAEFGLTLAGITMAARHATYNIGSGCILPLVHRNQSHLPVLQDKPEITSPDLCVNPIHLKQANVGPGMIRHHYP